MDRNDFATEDEIKQVHDYLLAGKPDFEEDKIVVIKSNMSREVKACPGSGKTTVLLAKLLILAKRMPFKDGSGICVITHTNVAVNEIKSRFGGNANALFSYPNFCGTIQSFVDQFLVIPWYNSLNDKSLVTIDDDRANAIIRRAFYSKGWPEQQKSKSLLHGNPDYKNACNDKDWNKVKKMECDSIIGVFYDQTSQKFYRNYNDGHVIAAYNPQSVSDLFQILNDVRLKPYREGILQYQDAYSTALDYLTTLPALRQSLSERFKYVFLDEAQDSNKLQLDLLERMFDESRVVFQRFGDPYQSLYDSEKPCAWVPKNPLPLNSSKRFGEHIAKVLRTVCIEGNMTLSGNPDVHSAMPIMIVYEDATKVLPKFVKILKENRIDNETVWEIAQRERRQDVLRRNNIKAIGHVGNKEDEKDTYTSIKQYFPGFESSNISKYPFQSSMTLNSFLQKENNDYDPSECRNRILEAIVSALEHVDVMNENGRKFTKTSLLEYLKVRSPKEYDRILNNLACWVIEILSSELRINPIVFDQVKSYIENEIASLFGFSASDSRLSAFLTKEEDAFYTVLTKEQSKNIYRQDGIEIEVATVHSVKGETHAATLYLETMYYAYESEHFGNQLCGEVYTKRAHDSRIQACLKVAYVGLSRPKYLLCYAIKKDRFDAIDCKGLRDIWKVEIA